MSEEESAKVSRLPCNYCKVRTRHTQVSSHTNSHTEWDSFEGEDREHPVYTEKFLWSLWICCGCETPLLLRRYEFEGDEDEDGRPNYHFSYFPERTEYFYQQRYFTMLPDNIKVIYRESCLAYNSKLALLCAGGVRALTEAICRDKNAAGRNLEKRIESLKTILPESLVNNLHSLRFLGNEALHELKPPSMSDLRLGLDVLSDLMNFLYDLDYKANRLNGSYLNNKKS